jgi:hypothetical protein
MKLKVLADYRNRDTFYVEGTILEVSAAEALFLRQDAPNCFEVIKDVEEPPVDKAVRPRTRRSRTKAK